MKNNLLLSIIVLIVSASCTRISTTEIGTGLIPPIDGINTIDTTIDVITQNMALDSIRVSKYQEFALGSISNDPLMGTTKAIINAEFKPVFYPHYFEVSKDSLFLDSAILVLSYQGLWGDSANQMKFKIYEIAQTSKLSADSVYPSYATMNIADQIGAGTIADPRRLGDSVFPRREQAKNQIRIPLNITFGNKLLKEFDSTNAYQSDAQFTSTFRGISIIPEMSNTSNTLLRVSLTDTNSKVALYYRFTKRDGNKDTVVRYFRTGAYAGAANNIVRSRTSAEVNTFLTNPAADADSLLYLQSGPGLYIKIKTPGLTGLTNRVIHRAELLMEQQAGDVNTDAIYTQPNLFLCAMNLDSARRFYVPNDIALGQNGNATNLNSFGGYVIYKNDPFGKRVASYNFNISRYVQGIATKAEKIYDLYLFAPVYDYVNMSESLQYLYPISNSILNPPGIGRVRLLGGNSKQAQRKMRLRIIYSKI